MNLLVIHPWIRLGGAESICWNLAAELRELGHSAQIVSTFVDPSGLPKAALGLDYALPPAWLARLCKRSRTFFLLACPWLLLALAWKHSRDVDVINPHNFPAAWIATVVGALRKIPVVWTCNEPPERLDWKTGLTVGIGDFLGWRLASSWVDRSLIRNVANVYVPSELTRTQVKSRYGIDPSVVRLGTDSKFYGNCVDAGVANKLNLEGKFVLLCVGRLHPQKNQLVCIQALERVLLDVPNAVLVLAGDGPLANDLAEEATRLGISSQVEFLGTTQPDSIRDLYDVCDINLLPASNQSWGLTPFEALCAERISVVSNECGAAEVLEEMEIGFVCDPTSEAFAENILAIQRDPKRSQVMAMRGRRFVEGNLTWRNYAIAVLGLMEEAKFSVHAHAVQAGHGLMTR